MLRIQKRYNFGYHEIESDDSALVNGKIVEFTSYPGSVYSQDDFYKVTKRNSKTETTVAGTELQNKNRQLWEKIMQKKDQVSIGAVDQGGRALGSVGGGKWSTSMDVEFLKLKSRSFGHRFYWALESWRQTVWRTTANVGTKCFRRTTAAPVTNSGW